MSEKQLPILMACRLSVRYEVNQLKAVPDIPYHVDKRVMRISWSMVSKAADRSSRVSAVTLPLSMLKGKQSQCLDHMGLTELIKSNNFQQQSYF